MMELMNYHVKHALSNPNNLRPSDVSYENTFQYGGQRRTFGLDFAMWRMREVVYKMLKNELFRTEFRVLCHSMETVSKIHGIFAVVSNKPRMKCTKFGLKNEA